jgi:hypothetical protein
VGRIQKSYKYFDDLDAGDWKLEIGDRKLFNITGSSKIYSKIFLLNEKTSF